jgi:hypothetical protein
MPKIPVGNAAEVQSQANRNYLEYKHFEIATEVCQTLQGSGLGKFTFSLIDSLWNELNTVLHRLERLPEVTLKELMQVIMGLTEARNELRHARFLFNLEEINSVHRLVMRNRAVVRGKDVLHKAILSWPYR